MSILEVVSVRYVTERSWLLPPARVLLPPFVDSRREVACVRYLRGCLFLPESGENCWSFLSPSAVGHDVGCGRRPCESPVRGHDVSLSWGYSYRRGDGCRGRYAPHLTRRGIEGSADGGLAPIKGRTESEGRCPCLPRVL